MKKHILSLCVGLVIILPTIGLSQIWVARYNGPNNGWDGGNAIAVDSSGNVYVAGSSDGVGSLYDYALIKYSSSGVEQWVSRYNGLGNGSDETNAITVDHSGNILVTGHSEGSGTGADYATIKYDAAGEEQWVARYNGPVNSYDDARAMDVDNAGNVYVTGYSTGPGTGFDYATVKYNSSGMEQWVERYNGPANHLDDALATVVDNSGHVYVTGWSRGPGFDFDFATIKYSCTGVEESRTTQIKHSSLTTTIFSGPLHLPEGKNCRVFDITGRVVEPDKITRGIYFIEVDGVVTQKVVKVR